MSVVNTATALVVNPAFLQEIKDSNPDLWELVRQVQSVCRSDQASIQVCRQLTRLLDELRDGLALQFSLEESYGYIGVFEPASEVLSELATKAQSQHGILYLGISELAEQAEELQYRGVEVAQLRRLVDRTVQFDEDLHKHERLETELIERSYGAK